MAYPQGIDFRASAGFVVDPANCDMEGAVSVDYPRTTPQGNTVGWTSPPGNTRDRNSGNDPRLAGIAFNNVVMVFEFDLPAAGAYKLSLACGDAAYGQSNQRVAVYDNTTLLSTLFTAGSTGSGNSFLDATGAVYTAAAWPASNTPVTLTFASTKCVVKIGDGVNNGFIAHLFLQAASSGTVITADVACATEAAATQRRSAVDTAESGSIVVIDRGLPIEWLASLDRPQILIEWLGPVVTDAMSPLEFTGTTRVARMPIEWLASTAISVTKDVALPIEVAGSVRGDRPAAVEAAAMLRADVFAADESTTLTRRDLSCPAELALALRRDAATQAEQTPLARADPALPAETSAGQKSDTPARIEWTGTAAVSVTGDQSLPIEAGATARGDATVAVGALRITRASADAQAEWSGAVVMVADQLARLEWAATAKSHSGTPAETSARLAADSAAPAEQLGTAARDAAIAVSAEAIMRGDSRAALEWAGSLVVGADILMPVEIVAGVHADRITPAEMLSTNAAIVADANSPIEILHTAGRDAGAPAEGVLTQRGAAGAKLESLGSAVMVIDALIPVESAGQVQAHAPMPVAFLAVATAEARALLESSGLVQADPGIAAENQGRISAGPLVALAALGTVSADQHPAGETLWSTRASVVAALESGMTIPAARLAVERGRLLATPGRLRLLKRD